MPGVQQTVAKHVARWAQQGSFTAYPAVRLLTFDVLVNQALGLGMDDAEIEQFSKVRMRCDGCSDQEHKQVTTKTLNLWLCGWRKHYLS
jgi:hypothetical protein